MKNMNSTLRRLVSCLMAFALFLSLLPTGILHLEAAAADSSDIGIYYTNPEGWGTVYGYAWEIGTVNPDWPGEKLRMDASGYYYLDLSAYEGRNVGVVFNVGGDEAKTADLTLPTLQSGDRFWCSSSSMGDDPVATYRTYAPGHGPRVTVHINANAANWSNVNAYSWFWQNSVDYELTMPWPGKMLSENSTNPGWYDLKLYDVPVSTLGVVFSKDENTKTGDLVVDLTSGDTEFWVNGSTAQLSAQAPSGWRSGYSVTVHYYNAQNWTAVHNYAWDNDGRNDYCGYWPGKQISENADHFGWYTMTVNNVQSNDLHFIFNNGTGGDGNQTANISIHDLEEEDKDSDRKVEMWYCNGALTASPPELWNSSSYTDSPSRTFYVPGTFPGAGAWMANSNAMTYTGANGIYRYTFTNVPAGTYEFKIAVNAAWTENYGVNGLTDGMNYQVTLERTGDVTVWYSDISHLAQTSVSYELGMDVTLSGSGIPATRMYDPRLTGIYSATVNLAKGTYNGVQITAGGKSYAFSPITLQEAKAVTFFVDPATGLYYHNAGGSGIDGSKVYYSTKNTTYKSVMGAVPNTAETTFRIRTGTDVKLVELVVGREADILLNVPMKPEAGDNGTLLWSCNPDFRNCAIADNYWYYFVLRNESGDRKIYSDDAGDWGAGKLVPDGMEWSYNLVIYKNGFQTPDWLKNAVIYQIFPDRFFNGDPGNDRAQTSARGDVDYEFPSWEQLPENPSLIHRNDYPSTAFKGDGQYSNEMYGGDLKGITEKIEYLKALGVTVIYLNPVFSSISNHRYDACDYNTIDPILGTLGDFEEMVAAAEANGMHIILDGVFNHVSDDSVYFDRYYKFLGKSEKIGAYPYWAYVYDLMNDRGYGYEAAKTEAKRYFASRGITDFSYTEWFKINNEKCAYSDTIGERAGKKVYSYEGWWGYDSMPVIYSTNGSEYQTGNWAQEIIYNQQGTSVTQYWIAKGSDGWRLDVANEVSDETWQRFRESVKSMNSSTVTVLGDGSTTYDDANDAAIVGEIWSDAAYYLLGDMYDSVMNYLFRDAAAGFARTYRINRDNKHEKLDADYTALDALNTLEATRERYPQEAFYAMMNLVGSHDTARILSYLDHVEDDGWGKENMANAYPGYAGTSEQAKRLQYVVALIQFTYPGAPTIYYGDEIGMVGSDDPDDRRAFEWGKGNKELVEWYALLAQIRNQYQTLRTGSLEPFAPNDGVMGYVRTGTDGSFVIMANRQGSAQSVTVDIETLGVGASVLTDLLSGSQYSVSGGTVTVNVPAYSGVILKTGAEEKVTLSADKAAALRPAYDASVTEQTPKWTVSYRWTGAPDGVKLPASVYVIDGGTCSVDTGYTAATVIEQKNETGKVIGRWTFSGWSRSGRLTVKGDITITGSWRYEKITPSEGFDVTYVWGDAPAGLVLPGEKGISAGGRHKVDEAYTSETVIEVKNAQGSLVGRWTFSGWDRSGTITVDADVVITGSWKYEALTEDEWQVTYEWTDAPDGVTLPQGAVVINGNTITVDNAYTALTVIEETDEDGNVTGRWLFSGWSRTGTITVTGDLVITGAWRYETVVNGTTPPPTPGTDDTEDPSQGTTGSGTEQQPTVPAGTDDLNEPGHSGNWWIVVDVGAAMALAGASGGWFYWYTKRKKEKPSAE